MPAEVQYIDLGFDAGLEALRFGGRCAVMPLGHPNGLLDYQWITVGPITHIWPHPDGPMFVAGDLTYTPAPSDQGTCPRAFKKLSDLFVPEPPTSEAIA